MKNNMKKKVNMIYYIFLIVWIWFLTGAFFSWRNTTNFVKNWIIWEWIVTDMIEKKSTDSNGTSYTYSPEVEFTTNKDEKIIFVSNHSSNPPAYSIWEKVEVIYLEEKPGSAKIKGFWGLWVFSFVFFVFWFVFSWIWFGFIYSKYRKNQLRIRLQQLWHRVETDFQLVDLNRSLTINWKHPYKIITKGEVYGNIQTFKSENIWFNPEQYINKEEKITVLVDTNNPKKYRMDISFLTREYNSSQKSY